MCMSLLVLIMHVSAHRCCVSPIWDCVVPSGGVVKSLYKSPRKLNFRVFVCNIREEISNNESNKHLGSVCVV